MYLLDTCAFIYYIGADSKMSAEAGRIISSGKRLFLSQVSLWKIAIKKTIKKLDIRETTYDIERICALGGIEIVPIRNVYFETIQTFPYIHGDPFDRLIMATAVEENLILLTDDANIRKYEDVRVVW